MKEIKGEIANNPPGEYEGIPRSTRYPWWRAKPKKRVDKKRLTDMVEKLFCEAVNKDLYR